MSNARGAEDKDITPYFSVLWYFLRWCFLINMLGPTGQLCQGGNPLSPWGMDGVNWPDPKDGQLCSKQPPLFIQYAEQILCFL